MEEERGWLENSTQLEPVLLRISKSSLADGYPFFFFCLSLLTIELHKELEKTESMSVVRY